jgi:hypothetical protein
LRRPDGRTYSAPDPAGTQVTRNLGILMEGATDAEATGIARQTADSGGISDTDLPEDILASAFADATGTLTADAVRAALASGHPYLRAIAASAAPSPCATRLCYGIWPTIPLGFTGDSSPPWPAVAWCLLRAGWTPATVLGSSRGASGRLGSTRRLGSQVMRHLAASPRSSGLVRPVTSSPETRSRTAGRVWISSGASRSAASRALMQSARRPQVP